MKAKPNIGSQGSGTKPRLSIWPQHFTDQISLRTFRLLSFIIKGKEKACRRVTASTQDLSTLRRRGCIKPSALYLRQAARKENTV